MTLTDDDRLWQDQTIPKVSDEDLEKIVQTFKDNDNDGKDKKLVTIVEDISECIMGKYTFLTVEENQEIWYYKEGVYVPGGQILIEKEAEAMYGYKLNSASLTQIIGHIMRRSYHKHEELDADINIINLKNGLYDIDNDVLKPHTPIYLSVKQCPITYDAKAKPKRFIKFLQEVLYARDILTIIDIMAYTFHRDHDIVEIVITLLGLGRNGKTVLVSLLSSLHGLDNVSNVPLAQMLGDRFALSDLEGKNVNIDNELGGQTIKETAIIKRLTQGSKQPIRIQRKNEKAYDTILYAKPIFCANRMPNSQDDSAAYHRRQVITTFPNEFKGKNEDPDLIKKLTKPEEQSAIFNILMRALRRIRRTKEIYINEKTTEERQEKYERAVNPVRAFMREAISEESNESHVIPKTYLYGVFNLFCNKHGLPVESYQNFCRAISYEAELKETRPLIDNERVQCWKGILLISEYAPKTDQTTL